MVGVSDLLYAFAGSPNDSAAQAIAARARVEEAWSAVQVLVAAGESDVVVADLLAYRLLCVLSFGAMLKGGAYSELRAHVVGSELGEAMDSVHGGSIAPKVHRGGAGARAELEAALEHAAFVEPREREALVEYLIPTRTEKLREGLLARMKGDGQFKFARNPVHLAFDRREHSDEARSDWQRAVAKMQALRFAPADGPPVDPRMITTAAQLSSARHVFIDLQNVYLRGLEATGYNLAMDRPDGAYARVFDIKKLVDTLNPSELAIKGATVKKGLCTVAASVRRAELGVWSDQAKAVGLAVGERATARMNLLTATKPQPTSAHLRADARVLADPIGWPEGLGDGRAWSGDVTEQAHIWLQTKCGRVFETKHVLFRGEADEEAGVDEFLHYQMLRAVLSYPPATLVLASEDANDNDGHGSFVDACRVALEFGWAVEIWMYSPVAAVRGTRDDKWIPRAAHVALKSFEKLTFHYHDNKAIWPTTESRATLGRIAEVLAQRRERKRQAVSKRVKPADVRRSGS
jgi:hypothetical protein